MAFYSSTDIKSTPKKKSAALPTILVVLTLTCVFGYFVATNKTVNEKISLYRCYWNEQVATKYTVEGSGTRPVTITSGLEPLEIGRVLVEKGIIPNANDFLCYVRKIEAGSKIQAGYYEITLPVTLEQLVPLLQSSRIPTFRVTLQEGLRMDEIAEKIDAAMGRENSVKTFSKEEFIGLMTDRDYIATVTYAKGQKTLEGYLFPDTYEIAKNASAKDVMDLLTSTFTKKVDTYAPLDSSKTYSPYQVLTMASIIEKEAGKLYEEKQTIAGILEKRIKNSWLLQVDAVFLYEKKDWKAPITIQDIQTDSPYNTYKRMGLPPTPICNPGIDSIKAVLNPKESPYWFYLHGTDGVVRYAKTNAEHQANKSAYLR